MSNGVHSPYRADIDGLRAVAVMCVVVYHAFPALLPGGFIGVDLFFVISGYLITGIILREQQAQSFSISNFYSKRVRRIFPALLLVLVFCFVAGWVALTFDEYKQLSKHTGASALFINNFILWKESGYFDNPAETKPLLHMWSLAVEEQFYLVWPWLLLLFHRVIRSVFWPTVLLVLASLVYSAWAVEFKPTAAFFSPLSRAWELLCGALLALWALRDKQIGPKVAQGLSAVGLACLLIGLFLIDKTSPFPGLWALLPVGAAVAFIGAPKSFVNQTLLGHPVMVWLGLISYPLYLWHWPLLVFARILEGQVPPVETRLAVVALSVLLAWLTYRLVEKPLRFHRNSKRVVATLCIGMLAVLLFSYYILANKGLAHRHYNKLNADPQTLVIGADRGSHVKVCGLDENKYPVMVWCLHDSKQPTPGFAVLGDSKGEALYYGLSRESGPGESWLMTGPVNYLGGMSQGLEYAALQRVLNDPGIHTVVLANALRGFTALDSKTGFIKQAPDSHQIDTWVTAYSQLFATLMRSGKQVVFVMDHPTLPDANDCISGPLTTLPVLDGLLYRKPNPHCQLAYSDHLKGTAGYQQFVEKLKAAHPDAVFFDPAPVLCDVPADRCQTARGQSFLYSYGDHISDYASSQLARQLLPLLNNKAAEATQ